MATVKFVVVLMSLRVTKNFAPASVHGIFLSVALLTSVATGKRGHTSGDRRARGVACNSTCLCQMPLLCNKFALVFRQRFILFRVQSEFKYTNVM